MRVRTWLAGFGLMVACGNASAQTPASTSLPGANNPLPGGSLPGTGALPGGSLPGGSTLPGNSGYLPGPSGSIRLPPQPLIPAGSQQPSPFPLPQAYGLPASVGPSSPVSAQNQAASASSAYGQPPPLLPGAAQSNLNQGTFNPVAHPLDVQLPYPENKFPINVGDLTLKRTNNGWQLWAGLRMLRDLGNNELDARGMLRILRDLRPTEWVSIGGVKPVVEYGLFQGRAPLVAGMPVAEDPNQPRSQAGRHGPVAIPAGADQVLPIDQRSVRIEAIQGVWCLRDDASIHLNFGANRADADQALAAVRRYAFNRLGIVGRTTPAMTYFFATPETAETPPAGPFVQAALQAQISTLHKVGVPVPGLGYVGEMIRLDPKSLTLRKVGSDWQVVAGDDVLGQFGPVEWSALDALHTIQQARFTEFCTVGSSGLTFFLTNGRAPSRAPYNTQVRTFDSNSLKVRQNGDRWAITENNRFLFDCASAEEGEILIQLLKAYQFDQICHLGPSPKTGISFLARTR